MRLRNSGTLALPYWLANIRGGWGNPEWHADTHYQVWLALGDMWSHIHGVDWRACERAKGVAREEPPADLVAAALAHVDHVREHHCETNPANQDCPLRKASAWLPSSTRAASR